MRSLVRRVGLAGVVFSVGALGLGGAQAQRFTDANSVGTTALPSGGQIRTGDAARPTASQIIARMLEKNSERLAALDRYTSERTYSVDYTGTGGGHHASVQVHAEYTGPDQKQLTVVSESGSKFICDKVLRKLVESEQEASQKSNRMQMTLGPENYDAELLGEETVDVAGTPMRAWILEMTPKVDNKFTYKGKVWISQDDYAIVRIHGEPAKSPSFWINRASFDSQYLRRGEVWLPAKNISTSHVRIGGEATLTIDYGTYPVVTAHALRPAVESAENKAQGLSGR